MVALSQLVRRQVAALGRQLVVDAQRHARLREVHDPRSRHLDGHGAELVDLVRVARRHAEAEVVQAVLVLGEVLAALVQADLEILAAEAAEERGVAEDDQLLVGDPPCCHPEVHDVDARAALVVVEAPRDVDSQLWREPCNLGQQLLRLRDDEPGGRPPRRQPGAELRRQRLEVLGADDPDLAVAPHLADADQVCEPRGDRREAGQRRDIDDVGENPQPKLLWEPAGELGFLLQLQLVHLHDAGLLAQDHGRGRGRGGHLEGEQGRRRSVAPRFDRQPPELRRRGRRAGGALVDAAASSLSLLAAAGEIRLLLRGPPGAPAKHGVQLPRARLPLRTVRGGARQEGLLELLLRSDLRILGGRILHRRLGSRILRHGDQLRSRLARPVRGST
mmetsp:Transcript_51885/g.152947  ORF Transcript_51885/g.152947 Transcript_51885/m.152947 type:complete len:390 (-) Transcript_51885:59-1228(-)